VELTGGVNPARRKIFREVELSTRDDVEGAARSLRDDLGVPLEAQQSWRTRDEALRKWRNAVELAGVFVFKNSFRQKEISGFCLTDDEFPVIYLNNSTAKSRQTFSLFHELCHLLLHTNSITKIDQSYIGDLGVRERRIEQFCNAVTAEFLIPAQDLTPQLRGIDEFDDDSVQRLADRYMVSREAILRRVLDLGLVNQEYYVRKAREWADETADGTGGNYYSTQATYLGPNYLRLVFSNYYQGRIGVDQVADYLGVKTKSVAGLEAVVARELTS
jgi:Zn-dependent peptidase ImmA (M78 family)